jgi:ABC-type Fe3+/spermidine/putrescine transport system ATPase subunit
MSRPSNAASAWFFRITPSFPHLDVGRNVAFGLHDWPTDQRDARVAEVLEWVGLQGTQRSYPHALSGGQQQRVALARALAPKPQLLLLDEPFSNLDVDLRERLAHEVRGILKSAGATALFVTHDQLEAFAIGDMIGVMHEGALHQWDDAYSLYHRPATRFVAEFIGHGVFAPATLVEVGGQTVVRTALGELNNIAECPCRPHLNRASAMCCCVPTTSCMTTMHPSKPKFCARRFAARSFSTPCVWAVARLSRPTCPATTTTASASG